MAKIAIFNQKGGVGKTTTSLNLAAALTRRGQVPLSIDLDPQAHLSAITGVSVENADDSLFSFYFAQKPLTPLVRQGHGGWPVIPAHVELSKVDAQSGKGPQVLNRLNSAIVRENLNTGRPIIMDCSPILGVLSLNAIFACDRILVPVSADWLAVKGVMQVDRTLRALEQHVFKRKLMRRFVITRFDTRRRMSHDIYEQIRGRFGEDVCETRISENVSVAESPAANEDVFTQGLRATFTDFYDTARPEPSYPAVVTEALRTALQDVMFGGLTGADAAAKAQAAIEAG